MSTGPLLWLAEKSSGNTAINETESMTQETEPTWTSHDARVLSIVPHVFRWPSTSNRAERRAITVRFLLGLEGTLCYKFEYFFEFSAPRSHLVVSA